MQATTIASLIVGCLALAGAALAITLQLTGPGRPVQFTVTHLTDRPRRPRPRYGDMPDDLDEQLAARLGPPDKGPSPRHGINHEPAAAAAPPLDVLPAAAAAPPLDVLPAPVPGPAVYEHPYPDPYANWRARGEVNPPPAPPAPPWPFGESPAYPSNPAEVAP